MKPLLFPLIWLASSAYATDVIPFVSDGCTFFKEGTHDHPNLWRDCCEQHDLSFWAGGSEAQRDLADLRLRECVSSKGQPWIAQLMYWGVASGKHSSVKLKGKRWGNAWGQEGSGYRLLSGLEVDLIREALVTTRVSDDLKATLMCDLEVGE